MRSLFFTLCFLLAFSFAFEITPYEMVAMTVQRDLANQTTLDRINLPGYTIYADSALIPLSNANVTTSGILDETYLDSHFGLWFENATIAKANLQALDSILPLGFIRRLDLHVFFNPERGIFQYCPFFDNLFSCDDDTSWDLVLDSLSRHMARSTPLEPTFLKSPFLVMIHPHVSIDELMAYDISQNPPPTTTTTTTEDPTTTTEDPTTTTEDPTTTTEEPTTTTEEPTTATEDPTATEEPTTTTTEESTTSSEDTTTTTTEEPTTTTAETTTTEEPTTTTTEEPTRRRKRDDDYPSVVALQRFTFSSRINANITSYLFTPKMASTSGIWPTQSSLFDQNKWLIFAFAPTATDYDTSKDSNLIFQGQTFDPQNTQPLGDSLLSACAQSFTDPSVLVTQFNLTSSFLGAQDQCVADNAPGPCLANTTVLPDVQTCGFSPLFTTLLDKQLTPLIWSWRSGEPGARKTVKNCTAISKDDGRWVALACDTQLPAVCRGNQTWALVQKRRTWAEVVCSTGTEFDVPRDAHENEEIYLTLLSQSANSPSLYWLNLKDVSGNGCWMVGGAACAYPGTVEGLTPDEVRSVITVSVIAGGVILSLSGIYLYYKVNQMYRFSQRRKHEKMRNRDLRIKFVPIPQ